MPPVCLCVSERLQEPQERKPNTTQNENLFSFYQNNCSFLLSHETGHVPALIFAGQIISLYFHRMPSRQKQQTEPNGTEQIWWRLASILSFCPMHDQKMPLCMSKPWARLQYCVSKMGTFGWPNLQLCDQRHLYWALEWSRLLRTLTTKKGINPHLSIFILTLLPRERRQTQLQSCFCRLMSLFKRLFPETQTEMQKMQSLDFI